MHVAAAGGPGAVVAVAVLCVLVAAAEEKRERVETSSWRSEVRGKHLPTPNAPYFCTSEPRHTNFM